MGTVLLTRPSSSTLVFASPPSGPVPVEVVPLLWRQKPYGAPELPTAPLIEPQAAELVREGTAVGFELSGTLVDQSDDGLSKSYEAPGPSVTWVLV